MNRVALQCEKSALRVNHDGKGMSYIFSAFAVTNMVLASLLNNIFIYMAPLLVVQPFIFKEN